MNSGVIELPNQEELYYVEWNAEYLGQNPSVIFVHGNSSSSYSWLDSIEGIKHINKHIIALDQRGFGKSSYKNHCNRFKQWAEDLKDFCIIKGIKRCIVNGWSFGGGVTMKFAQIAPELVEKIILTNSAPHKGLKIMNGEKECKTAEQIKEVPRIKAMLSLIEQKDYEKIAEGFRTIFHHKTENQSQEKMIQSAKVVTEQRCWIQVCEAVSNSDIDITKIKAKGLVIHGDEDMSISIDIARQTATYFDNFVIMKKHGHMIPVENPQEYQKIISQFIQS